MEHDETGCQPAPEGPILCINNCGFFGSAATMNMCSKCHKDLILKQEQAKLAATSIENLVNGSSSGSGKGPASSGTVDVQLDSVEQKTLSVPPTPAFGSGETVEAKPKEKEGSSKCATCKKRVGLTGFKCKCGNLFCGSHRYSDKHECPFDYRTAAQDAIAKANPVVKADKLDKI
ncbi:zinc finger A20 and AN1 domain-containing stress-associated protein 4-like [Rhododendron vialii]|uniref:zinc finger A20 and AN1 domain-containing stress-associated protein 4-like n=1 Tax=Rhododendron vialii TaxID=182163 RepID=UPI002660088A|nr:zinc finger A20 and AN1 domain-containing stress-associated protein 4-like [Rhododendron vialii]XP_058199384.1 zinc finger A20 and AN1 domain-containing stress-associated protein 4-like [Rhododendron vialii]XP_058199385.1 zinc finger A20 and AN1 domain-containing stress-associated protein 4-like [Rhododendron vialii]XP_058199387.1 zinc finger A20 and AN1 domain-containing stress-associated protein 4-like [Rhododendron vialii]